VRASELRTFGQWLPESPLASDRFWNRDLELVSDTEISLFYARAGLQGLKAHAVEAIDRLQTALILAAIDGTEVPKEAMRLVAHEPPVERFAVDEFIDLLVKLPDARRSAVLYALAMHDTPERVTELTWSEARKLIQMPPQIRDILAGRAKVRHLKLPYVFWEHASDRVAAPLVQLAVSAEEAFGMPWPRIQQRYSCMLWVSGKADVASFQGLVEEVAAGRL
jgi:hypothetical protein